MPDFRIRSDCRRWFQRILGRSELKLLFDPYYMCFLIGIAAGHRTKPTEGGIDAPAFVDSSPRPYDQQQRLLLGLMLAAELRRAQIDLGDRASVNQVVSDLAGIGGLTAAGVSVMNGYASGGFDKLMTLYDGEEPWSLEEFMPRFLRILEGLMAESDIAALWAPSPQTSS
jgi:hypothetical protein